MQYLGHTVTDRITGFRGIVTGQVEYLTGCNQVLVVARSPEPTKEASGVWFDQQRVEIDHDVERLVLDNGATPGCDLPAPKR